MVLVKKSRTATKSRIRFWYPVTSIIVATPEFGCHEVLANCRKDPQHHTVVQVAIAHTTMVRAVQQNVPYMFKLVKKLLIRCPICNS